MRIEAAVLERIGAPKPYAESRPLKIETLTLDPPGSGEVLVRIAAAGLCHSDLSVINGDRPRPTPMALGHEAAGVVVEVGADVPDLAPGNHVVMVFMPSCGHCLPCAEGRPALCEPGAAANGAGTLLSGGRRLHGAEGLVHHHLGVSAFADHAVVSRRSLVKIDPDIPLESAALFGCAVLTGVGAAVNTAGIRPGQAVAVVGLGGVGLASLLGAIACGARQVVAVDLAEDKLALARSLGASDTVNARDEDAVEQIRALTGGGAEVVLEMAGSGRAMALAFAATRRGGTTVTAGLPPARRGLSRPPGAAGRRGAVGKGQLYRQLRADARSAPLSGALSRRAVAGRSADDGTHAARCDQRRLRRARRRSRRPAARNLLTGPSRYDTGKSPPAYPARGCASAQQRYRPRRGDPRGGSRVAAPLRALSQSWSASVFALQGERANAAAQPGSQEHEPGWGPAAGKARDQADEDGPGRLAEIAALHDDAVGDPDKVAGRGPVGNGREDGCGKQAAHPGEQKTAHVGKGDGHLQGEHRSRGPRHSEHRYDHQPFGARLRLQQISAQKIARDIDDAEWRCKQQRGRGKPEPFRSSSSVGRKPKSARY